MEVKVNKKELEKQIEKTIRDAAGGYGGYGGNSQLYGRYDEDGNIYEFFIHTDMGNSFVAGEGIVPLFVQKWFDPLENEYLKEWFEQEKENNDDLKKINGIENLTYEDFQELYPNLLDKLYVEWSEIALNNYLPEMINDAIRRLEEEREYEEIKIFLID